VKIELALVVPSAPPRRVPAVDRAARLLGLLEADGRPMTISELARQLGINKGTMRDLLETLRAHGLVERDEDRKLYRLGPRLARLGMAALGQLDLARVARPFLVELASEVNGAVLLLVPHDDSATIGRRIRLAAGACGKVFLAHLAEPERAARLAELRQPTARSITDPARYAAELEQTRRRGYATDDEEYLAGVRATSAPVFDARGRVAAAVLVIGLVASLPLDDLERTGQATARTARAISVALGAPA